MRFSLHRPVYRAGQSSGFAYLPHFWRANQNLYDSLYVCYSEPMLTFKDEETVRNIVQEEIKPLEKKIDQVLNLLDKFAGNIQSHQQQLAMVEGHKDQLEDHEERITTLESSLANA